MILPVCQPFPVLTHSRPRLARRPVTIRSEFVTTLNHFDPHRHYILELVQAGVDPRPPLPLEQGLRDLLVRVRLRHWRISVLSTTMLGCRGAVAAHNVPTPLRAPSCFCLPTCAQDQVLLLGGRLPCRVRLPCDWCSRRLVVAQWHRWHGSSCCPPGENLTELAKLYHRLSKQYG